MRSFEDFPAGQTFALGTYPVTREEIVEFATEFDPQPFHLDEEAGAASLLGGLAASGWHVCAILMRLICDAYVVDSTCQGSGGCEEIAWKRPVRPGDTLSGTSIVTAARLSAKRPDLGICNFRTELTNQSGETVATCDHVVFVLTQEGRIA